MSLFFCPPPVSIFYLPPLSTVYSVFLSPSEFCLLSSGYVLSSFLCLSTVLLSLSVFWLPFSIYILSPSSAYFQFCFPFPFFFPLFRIPLSHFLPFHLINSYPIDLCCLPMFFCLSLFFFVMDSSILDLRLRFCL